MGKSLIFLALVLLIVNVESLVFSAGFSIYEHGAAATSQAGAFVGRADDPSCLFYNPAGMNQLEGFQINVGTTAIFSYAELDEPAMYGGEHYEAEKQVFFPTTIYASYKLNDRISAGFGFFSPFGLGMDWGGEYTGRYLVEKVDLQSFYLNPAVSFQVIPELSLALGVDYVLADVELERSINLLEMGLDDAHAAMEGDNGSGNYTFNFGSLYRPCDYFQAGLSYRHEVDVDFEGTVDFDLPLTGIPAIDDALRAALPDGDMETTMTFPSFATLGMAFFPMPKLEIELDVNWWQWSSFDELVLRYSEGMPEDTVVEKNWDDVFCYRFGAEYAFNDQIKARLGYLYDESPIPDETLDPMLPGADRNSFQFGFGFSSGAVTIDAGYMYLLFDERTSDLVQDGFPYPATYESKAHLLGLSFNYKM